MTMDEQAGNRFMFDAEARSAAKLCVIGVGGGGGNAVDNMIREGLQQVDFIVVNTDAQALTNSMATQKIQAGRRLTKGLGAGARPFVGAEAVTESMEEVESMLQGFDMAFITAGMGGGTGTGGAPVVAQIAQRMDLLTVAIVTKPFDCEGKRRMDMAMVGISELRKYVDTLIVIPNERLLDIADDNTTLEDAFRKADKVLYDATRGISDLITLHGLINLDFADVRTTIEDGGTALMGSAKASGGPNRAESAALNAISSPLMDGLSIAGARNVLVNITAGKNLGIRETTDATKIIHEEAGEGVEVIFGTVIDENMGDEMRVTVIATGFSEPGEAAEEYEAADAKPEPQEVRNIEDIDWEKLNTEPASDRRKPKVRSPKARQSDAEQKEGPQIIKIEKLGEKHRQRPSHPEGRRYFPKMMD